MGKQYKWNNHSEVIVIENRDSAQNGVAKTARYYFCKNRNKALCY